MTVATTSKEAYQKLKKLGDKQQQVLDALGDLGIASNQDIAEALGWSINRVTGRMKELRDYGYVAVHGLKTNQFGNSVKTWCVTDPYAQKQIDLVRDPIEEIKLDKWGEDGERWTPEAVPWMAD